MKRSILITTGVVLLNVAGWYVVQQSGKEDVDQPEPELVNNGPNHQQEPRPKISETQKSPRVLKNAIVEPAPSDLPDQKLPPHLQAIFDRMAKSHEKKEQALTIELALSETQKAHLRDFHKKAEEVLAGWLTDGSDFMNSEAGVRQIAALARGDELRSALEEFASEEQLTKYDAYKRSKWERQVEAQAYKELAKITPVLNLTEDQKDQVFAVIQDSASERLKNEADFRAAMELYSGPTAAQMEMTDLALMRLMVAAEQSGDFGSPEFMAQLKKTESQRIEQEVSHLEGILSSQQSDQYREHLNSTGLIEKIRIRTGR